ncbi:hypothetical protein ACLOJK_039442 [Asimina triloba]
MPELQSHTNVMCGGSHGLSLLSSEGSARTNGCSPCGEFSASPALLGCENRQPGGVDIVAEISAELQRERQKNAELIERIMLLEAELHEGEGASVLATEQDCCAGATNRSFKKFKRQKIERNSGVKDMEREIDEGSTKIKHQIPSSEAYSQSDHIVNWMSMDETQLSNFEKLKDGDSAVDCGDTDDSDDDDYDEDDTDIEEKSRCEDDDSHVADESKSCSMRNKEAIDDMVHIQKEPTALSLKQEIHADQTKIHLVHAPRSSSQDASNASNLREIKRNNMKESKKFRIQKASVETHCSIQDVGSKLSGNLLSDRKPPKLAFCPKEVRRIMASEVLQQKNAQAHTIRKIIVFASLGIRHGCEDMYELDFNHFRILRKGEPYVSPKDPGEHILYEHPGVQKKIFYPNRENPILCPVQILEEEKAMRPSDPSCPSCLYVRQRMGRNKLKSFGPLVCDMVLLAHIRSGSFFFKALGITLLFMAGFTDDLVQRETKYRNLDLLQKYYRTDEDAEGEELFRPHRTLSDTAISGSQLPSCKSASGAPKSQGKKQMAPGRSQSSQRSANVMPSPSSNSVASTQFGLMGFSSIHTQAMPALHAMQSHTVNNASPIPKTPPVPIPNPNNIRSSHAGPVPPPYPMFPPYPMNTFMPLSYWHNTNAYPPCPYPSYEYRPLLQMTYAPHQSHPYNSQPSCYPIIPNAADNMKEDVEEPDSDSDSSSSGTELLQKAPSTSHI